MIETTHVKGKAFYTLHLAKSKGADLTVWVKTFLYLVLLLHNVKYVTIKMFNFDKYLKIYVYMNHNTLYVHIS